MFDFATDDGSVLDACSLDCGETDLDAFTSHIATDTGSAYCAECSDLLGHACEGIEDADTDFIPEGCHRVFTAPSEDQ